MSDRILDEFVYQTITRFGEERASVVEERISLVLQPKPRWWPQWVYERVIRRLLILKEQRL